jgi:glutamate carboxypeptidase
MEKSPATAYLVELVLGIASQRGFSFKDVHSGGTSDGNFIGELGVPALDGLGPVGGSDHSPGEFLEPETIVPRTAMLAGLVEAITANLDRIRSFKSGGV